MKLEDDGVLDLSEGSIDGTHAAARISHQQRRYEVRSFEQERCGLLRFERCWWLGNTLPYETDPTNTADIMPAINF